MCTRYIPPEVAEIERFWSLPRGYQPDLWPREMFPRAPGPFSRPSERVFDVRPAHPQGGQNRGYRLRRQNAQREGCFCLLSSERMSSVS